MWGSLVFWLIIMSAWLLSIWAAVAFIGGRLLRGRSGGNMPQPDPLEGAKRRYASGEITKADFDQINADLHQAAPGDFIGYPANYLFGVIDDKAEAKATVDDLVASGIPSDAITLFSDEAGALRIDASGSRHGFFARLVRLSQAISMDMDQSGRYEEEAREGHTVVAMHADGAEQQQSGRAILKRHHGHYINWYGRLAFETLDP